MDVAAQMVDKEIEQFERKLKKEYEKAQKAIEKECKQYLKKYQKKDKKMQEKVKQKQVSHEDYITWRMNQLAQGKRYQDLMRSIENQLVQTNVVAAKMVNDATPRVYTENINYAMYDVEKGIKAQTSFSLYNTTTVRNSIMKGDMYIPKASVDIPKDRLWNRKKVQSVFTQSIIKGESIPEISKSLRQVTDANRAQATRTARTCMTAVQNDARIDGYTRARELGIDVKKGWLATLDNRTRQSHRHIDGEIVELEEEFSNGCQYPGDSRGKPEEIYNCRCTLVPKIGNEKMLPMSMRANNLPAGISYDDWKGLKAVSYVVNGKDISATWKRRKDEFDFVIEDVINAQGFDGKPKVVSKEEFDEAVKRANGGNGFIAQRTYSAPDQETLDAYRDQLYNGKWYVDCSEGGSVFGKGMYTSSDYTGELSDSIKMDMIHYREIGESKFEKTFDAGEARDRRFKMADAAGNEVIKRGGTMQEARQAYDDIMSIDERTFAERYARDLLPSKGVSYIETMTLDSSAKIITYKDIDSMRSYSNIQERLIHSAEISDDQRTKLLKILIEDEDDSSSITDGVLRGIAEEIENKSDEMMHMDVGSLATLYGYDAIDTGGYTVILNRTKVIILEG